MTGSRRFERQYLQYIIKSSKIFWLYIGVFVVIFFALATGIKVDIHETERATVTGEEISEQRTLLETIFSKVGIEDE